MPPAEARRQALLKLGGVEVTKGQSTVFEDVLGTSVENMHYLGDSGADRLAVGWVTPNIFTFLGVRPLLGRAFEPEDTLPSSPAIAVLNQRT